MTIPSSPAVLETEPSQTLEMLGQPVDDAVAIQPGAQAPGFSLETYDGDVNNLPKPWTREYVTIPEGSTGIRTMVEFPGTADGFMQRHILLMGLAQPQTRGELPPDHRIIGSLRENDEVLAVSIEPDAPSLDLLHQLGVEAIQHKNQRDRVSPSLGIVASPQNRQPVQATNVERFGTTQTESYLRPYISGLALLGVAYEAEMDGFHDNITTAKNEVPYGVDEVINLYDKINFVKIMRRATVHKNHEAEAGSTDSRDESTSSTDSYLLATAA